MSLNIFSMLRLAPSGSDWVMYPIDGGVLKNQSKLSSNWDTRPEWEGVAIQVHDGGTGVALHGFADQLGTSVLTENRFLPTMLAAMTALAQPDDLEMTLNVDGCILESQVIQLSEDQMTVVNNFLTANQSVPLINLVYRDIDQNVLAWRLCRYDGSGNWTYSLSMHGEWYSVVRAMRDSIRVSTMTVVERVNVPNPLSSEVTDLSNQIAELRSAVVAIGAKQGIDWTTVGVNFLAQGVVSAMTALGSQSDTKS